VGITYQSETGTVEEHMLYEAEFVRPRDHVALDVEMAELSPRWPRQGALTLGGESRAARYRQLDQAAQAMPYTSAGDCFKLYLATPAFFEGGWQPGGGWKKLLGPKADLVGAALGQPLVVGGFDLARRKHKPSRRFVPAGSVYYFTGQVTPKSPITQWGARIGLGHYFVGGWTC
jgi:CRISPR-associated protein Cmr3